MTGFLGAGITSFIQSYADWLRRQDTSFAVAENDFGAVGMDAAALREEGGDVFEVSGECICCSLTPNFTELLLRLCGHYERIIVEPSGVFDAAVFYSIMDTLRRKTEVELGFCAVIVNPHALAELDNVPRSPCCKASLPGRAASSGASAICRMCPICTNAPRGCTHASA